MSSVHLLVVPYDSGRRDWRMGSGPLVLAGPVAERLRVAGHVVTTTVIEAPEPRIETGSFALCRVIAEATRGAVARGEFPLVLSGNCIASVGLLAGLRAGRRGIVWLDAHGDYNTPDTSPSGYLDGQCLAAATGRCWTTVTGSIPGHVPLAEEDVILAGARDIDPGERVTPEASSVTWLSVEQLRAGGLSAAVGRLAARVEVAVLHLDADVHDPVATPANTYPAPGGLFPEEVAAIARDVFARLPVAGMTVAAYDAGVDAKGATGRALVDVVGAAVGEALRPGRS